MAVGTGTKRGMTSHFHKSFNPRVPRGVHSLDAHPATRHTGEPAIQP